MIDPTPNPVPNPDPIDKEPEMPERDLIQEGVRVQFGQSYAELIERLTRQATGLAATVQDLRTALQQAQQLQADGTISAADLTRVTSMARQAARPLLKMIPSASDVAGGTITVSFNGKQL